MISTRNFKSGWSPRSLPVTLWLDGNDPAGNGVLPANTTAISAFVDKSGNGRNFTQVAGAKQPLYGAAVQNGKGVLICNGTTHSMVLAATLSTIINASLFTIYAAFSSSFTNLPGATITQEPGIICDVGGYFSLQIFQDVSLNKFGGVYCWDNLSNPVSAKQANVTAIINTPTIIKIYRDATTIYAQNGNGTVSSFPCAAISNTANGINLFLNWIGDRWFSGNFYEMFCMNIIATAQQDKFAKNYLMAKWGIS